MPSRTNSSARGKTTPRTARKPARSSRPADERTALLRRIAERLGVSSEEAELRALRELAARLGADEERASPDAPAQAAEPRGADAPAPSRSGARRGLPPRLFLHLDGRGLDGRGMPVEVIDLPTLLGSGKKCQIWVNSPQIETRHLQITQEDGEFIVTDLQTEHGTFLAGRRVQRRVVEDGDEFRLAGYLRVRAELR